MIAIALPCLKRRLFLTKLCAAGREIHRDEARMTNYCHDTGRSTTGIYWSTPNLQTISDVAIKLDIYPTVIPSQQALETVDANKP
jgi:hypothetical protein